MIRVLMATILFILSISFVQARPSLRSVNVDCPESVSCTQRTLRFKGLVGEYRSLVHLKDTIKIMASDGGYQSFSYKIIKHENNYDLHIRLRLKPIINEINIGFLDRSLEADAYELLTIKEGEYYEPEKLKASIENLQRRLEGLGYPHNTQQFEVIEKDQEVKINIAVKLGEPKIFKSIKTNTSSTYIHEFLKRKFFSLYNKPFDFTKFKLYLDDAQRELFTYGYYLISLDFTSNTKGNRVVLDIKVQNDRLFAFDFEGIEREDRDGLLVLVTDLFKKYKRPLNELSLKQAIQEHYEKLAFLNTEIEISVEEHLNKYKETQNLYRIKIKEGTKTRLAEVSFSGSSHFTEDELKKMFQKEAFELASLKYHDKEYFEYFANYLRNRYLEDGYVQVRIDGPQESIDESKQQTRIEYEIIEGRRAYVRNINFSGLPSGFEENVLNTMSNKVGDPFDPIALVEDIRMVASSLQESGYYFAEVSNGTDDSMVSYSRTGGEVDINFIVNPGPLVRLNRVLFLGNDKTRKKVLMKKINLETNDLVTPAKTRDIESAISATGLFNSVSVFPVRHTSKSESTDLIVKVSEREYGLVELAPGYRTDLGLKLSGTVSYLNIGGYNRSITLRSQVNQRLNYQTLDERRQKEKKQSLEHNTSLTYNQGDIFNTDIDLGLGTSFQRKRFYSFDADIWRINSTLTKDISRRLSSSLRYQYETIAQSDATEERDNGSFQIGAITPSLTYDLRNSQINPVKGAFFNLSVEFANPYFLSQKNDELTVNYYKLVSRNRFYIPYKNGTLAISLVGGIQENLAREKREVDGTTQTEGYIPSIKVFRLTGMENVRGFDDTEINLLADGKDISEARIDNRAYLANFKLEPRYFINDSLMAGVFYDAGRVFINNVDLGELRDSVGVTFKIVTPVGTLDFDYGIKLLRKKDANGRLEDPGRFHVSIGFF